MRNGLATRPHTSRWSKETTWRQSARSAAYQQCRIAEPLEPRVHVWGMLALADDDSTLTSGYDSLNNVSSGNVSTSDGGFSSWGSVLSGSPTAASAHTQVNNAIGYGATQLTEWNTGTELLVEAGSTSTSTEILANAGMIWDLSTGTGGTGSADYTTDGPSAGRSYVVASYPGTNALTAKATANATGGSNLAGDANSSSSSFINDPLTLVLTGDAESVLSGHGNAAATGEARHYGEAYELANATTTLATGDTSALMGSESHAAISEPGAYSFATLSGGGVAGSLGGSSNGLATADTVAVGNSPITHVTSSMGATGEQAGAGGTVTGEAQAFGNPDGSYAGDDHVETDHSASITDVDSATSRARATRDWNWSSLASTLDATITLSVADTSASATPRGQTATGTVTGAANGDGDRSATYSAGLTAEDGGRASVGLAGDAPQDMPTGPDVSGTVSGNASLVTPGAGTQAASQLDVNVGSATLGANASFSQSINNNGGSGYASTSADGEANRNDDPVNGLSTYAVFNSSMSLPSGTPATGAAAADAGASASTESASAEANANGTDGAYIENSTSARVPSNYAAGAGGFGEGPIDAATSNSYTDGEGSAAASFGVGSATGSAGANALSAGPAFANGSASMTTITPLSSNTTGNVAATIDSFTMQVDGDALVGGWAHGAEVSFALNIGVDNDGNGTVDQGIFSGAGIVYDTSAGPWLYLSSGAWTNGNFTINNTTGQVTLNTLTFSSSSATAVSGARAVISFSATASAAGEGNAGNATFAFNT